LIRKRRRILLLKNHFISSAARRGLKEYAMSQVKKSKRQVPAVNQLDSEVVAFRAQFEPSSPLDEIVRQGAQSLL
jgi:hypothetical protein